MSERVISILIESFPKLLAYGIKVTVPLTLLSFVLALFVALIVAVIQYAKIPLLSFLCRVYIWIIRGTPVLVQLFIVFYGLPSVGIVFDAFPAAVLVFGLNEGAYMAESIRAALESVPQVLISAARVQGASRLKAIFTILIPIASKVAVPSLFNSLISMLKGTSLAANITIVEMFREAQVITAKVYEPLALYSEAALIYLLFCTLLTFIQNWVEKKLQ